MTTAQMETLRARDGHQPGRGMGPVRRPRRCRRPRSAGASSTACRSTAKGRAAAARRRAFRCRRVRRGRAKGAMSTQAGFGKHPRRDRPRRRTRWPTRIVTTSPDVTVSTNLGAWVNRRGLFARESRRRRVPGERSRRRRSNWEIRPKGQHIELGIAEMNLFLLLSALGLSHSLFGERLLPIGTLYDPFIYRGLDALNYACYQDARFMLVATPSGITLAPEGGAHQSIAHAADRHGAGRARRLRAGLRRRARGDHATGPSTTCSATATASRRAQPGSATRRAARSICGSRPGRSSSSRAR